MVTTFIAFQSKKSHETYAAISEQVKTCLGQSSHNHPLCCPPYSCSGFFSQERVLWAPGAWCSVSERLAPNLAVSHHIYGSFTSSRKVFMPVTSSKLCEQPLVASCSCTYGMGDIWAICTSFFRQFCKPRTQCFIMDQRFCFTTLVAHCEHLVTVLQQDA